MGGNAFKELNVSRIPHETYEVLIPIIMQGFYNHGIQCKVARSLPKETHGDVDFVIGIPERKGCYLEDVEDVINGLSAHPPIKNDTTTSIAYTHTNGEIYQLDFDLIDEDRFVEFLNWHDWNDLPAILGRFASKLLKAKYRQDGLYFDIRSDVLSKDFPVNLISFKAEGGWRDRGLYEFLSILDLDYYKWKRGFDSELDMFKWVSSSIYFQEKYFVLESQTHKQRSRLKRRPMYMRFVEYCEGLKPKLFPHYFDLNSHKEWFHKIQAQMARIVRKEKQELAFREAFNGNLVFEFLSGDFNISKDQEFGKLMQHLNEFNMREQFHALQKDDFELFWKQKAKTFSDFNFNRL